MEIMLTPPSTGAITQYYGNGSDRGVHSGNDYAYSSGGKIHDKAYAMHDGIIEWADDTRKLGWPNKYYFNPDFNRNDDIDHSAGIATVIRAYDFAGVTTYCHLDDTRLNPGDKVKRGDVVGTVGQTGFSLGKHLHAELILDDHDFSTPTGGRADLNLYMVDKIIPVSNTVGEWDEMASKAEIEEVVSRLLDEKLHKHLDEFRPGIAGKRHAGATYVAVMNEIGKARDAAIRGADAVTGGIAGVKFDGALYALVKKLQK